MEGEETEGRPRARLTLARKGIAGVCDGELWSDVDDSRIGLSLLKCEAEVDVNAPRHPKRPKESDGSESKMWLYVRKDRCRGF